MNPSNPNSDNDCEVLVMGGGPAGSTAATLLARQGRKVILLDKVQALGVFKPGADFEADNQRGYNSFEFKRAIGNSPAHAYQVWCQDFDCPVSELRG